MDWRAHTIRSVKAAAAAGLAWLLVLPLWGVADEYPYYAPLGAVIAVSTTVAGSVRESLQAVLGIALGAVIAVAVMTATDVPVAVDIVLVVLVASVVSGWRRLGSQRSFVPVSAIFVLILGQDDPIGMSVAYV